jgi:dCTP deaminase
MAKNDRWIREMAQKGMIEPFQDEQVREGVISFGISSYGYDMRVYDEFNFNDYKGEVCMVPPNSYIICRSLEYFRIPRDVIVVCFGKSTYARSGVIVNVTPLEPEWEGFITMSVSNTSPFPVKIYANEGIAQIVFLEASELCEISYADKKGKYQAQKGIVLPKI